MRQLVECKLDYLEMQILGLDTLILKSIFRRTKKQWSGIMHLMSNFHSRCLWMDSEVLKKIWLNENCMLFIHSSTNTLLYYRQKNNFLFKFGLRLKVSRWHIQHIENSIVFNSTWSFMILDFLKTFDFKIRLLLLVLCYCLRKKHCFTFEMLWLFRKLWTCWQTQFSPEILNNV